jgi:hypothetical protein
MLKEEQVKMIAETLLPGFLPKDPAEAELSFHFTVPPNQSFKVWYGRNNKNTWDFKKFEPVQV